MRAFRQSADALGNTHHQRHAVADAPAGELLPVLLFAEMPAVIAPQDDDGVVALRALIERSEHASEHGVGKMNGGEIGLDAPLPLPLFLNVLEVTIARDLHSRRWQIVHVTGLETRSGLDRLQRKRFEILLRHKPWLMGSIQSTGQEEGLVALELKLLADPLRHQPVTTELFITHIERRPVGFIILPLACARQIHGPLRRIKRAWKWVVLGFGREVIIPRLWIDDVMEHLPRTRAPVAVA